MAIHLKFARLTYVLSLRKDTLREKLIQRDYRVQNYYSFFSPNDFIREIIPWIAI